jgi:hypothetical protein
MLSALSSQLSAMLWLKMKTDENTQIIEEQRTKHEQKD